MTSKICTQCEENKLLSYFANKLGKKTSQCKKCINYNRKIYREENPDLVKATKELSRLKNIEKELEKAKDAYRKDKEDRKLKARTNYYHNQEELSSKNSARARTPRQRFFSACITARRRKIVFSLTLSEYEDIIRDNKCFYCEEALPPVGSGLDRINNDRSIGYTKGNVVACCTACNQIRGKHISQAEMIEVAKLLKRMRNG